MRTEVKRSASTCQTKSDFDLMAYWEFLHIIWREFDLTGFRFDRAKQEVTLTANSCSCYVQFCFHFYNTKRRALFI